MNEAIKTKGRAMFCAAAVLAMLLIAGLPASIPAYAAENPLSITVEQAVNTSSSPAGSTFKYGLKPLGPGTPMPQGSTESGYTFTITGNSIKDVGPMDYDRQGRYRYELFQVIEAEKPGWTYDKRLYTVEVHVGESLRISLVVINVDGTKEDGIRFENKYQEPPTDPSTPTVPPGPTDPPKPGGEGKPDEGKPGPLTGDDTQAAIFYAMFVFGSIAATGAVIYLIMGKRHKKDDCYKNQ